ncbi:Protein CBG20538 [Caenorhabditis briggsae]|uniref:Protein CBG20538 n=1 Tax=Caenorhabditis briggsae TaxID=6238 RepID=A8XY11_CAEBR|nr:Protein CBG20538 [Caenorhabditis briggsae]CAP37530.1 Protein CBG20538 [Caenorhabditis briggsae]
MKNYEACETEKNSVAYEVPGDKIDGGMICGNSNFEIDEGINSSANFAILDVSHRDHEHSKRLAVANFGANLNFSKNEGIKFQKTSENSTEFQKRLEMSRKFQRIPVFKLKIQKIQKFENFQIGTGLSYSTGIKIQPESVKIHVLDYGFEYDNDGFALEIQMVRIFEFKIIKKVLLFMPKIFTGFFQRNNFQKHRFFIFSPTLKFRNSIFISEFHNF